MVGEGVGLGVRGCVMDEAGEVDVVDTRVPLRTGPPLRLRLDAGAGFDLTEVCDAVVGAFGTVGIYKGSSGWGGWLDSWIYIFCGWGWVRIRSHETGISPCYRVVIVVLSSIPSG